MKRPSSHSLAALAIVVAQTARNARFLATLPDFHAIRDRLAYVAAALFEHCGPERISHIERAADDSSTPIVRPRGG